MANVGKKYADSVKLLEKNKLYDPAEALALVCQTSKAKFDETIEIHIRLGVDSRHADQQVRGAVVLPNGTGKTAKVLVFTKGDNVDKAKEAGAEYVGGLEFAEKIQKENWFDFDVVVASPDMMGLVGRLGKILGPQGLMPNPKLGTVTMDVAKMVSELKAGRVEYRADRYGICHVPLGKKSFSEQQLVENYAALYTEILRVKPSSAKGKYVKSISVSSTMGPGVKVDPAIQRDFLAE